MEERISKKSDLETYDIKFILQDESIKIYPTIYNDALFQVNTLKSQ